MMFSNKTLEPTPGAGFCESFDVFMFWVFLGAAQLGRSAEVWPALACQT
jgi:hypothetical protein